jgi:hypothetical protein
VKRILTVLGVTVALLVAGWVAGPATANVDGVALSTASVVHQAEMVTDANGQVKTYVDGHMTPISVTAPSAVESVLYCCPYNNFIFGSRFVCQDNNIGTTWRIDEAGTAFEDGNNGIVLSYARPGVDCGGTEPQIIHYSVYNAADNKCSKSSGNYLIRPSDHKQVWNGNLNVQMNNSYPTCKDTLQRRDNRISVATGGVLGLAYYTDPNEVCIMNSARSDINNFAQVCDRNRTDAIY